MTAKKTNTKNNTRTNNTRIATPRKGAPMPLTALRGLPTGKPRYSNDRNRPGKGGGGRPDTPLTTPLKGGVQSLIDAAKERRKKEAKAKKAKPHSAIKAQISAEIVAEERARRIREAEQALRDLKREQSRTLFDFHMQDSEFAAFVAAFRLEWGKLTQEDALRVVVMWLKGERDVDRMVDRMLGGIMEGVIPPGNALA